MCQTRCVSLRVLCDSAGSMLALLREDRDCGSRQHMLMGPGAIPEGDRRKGPDYKMNRKESWTRYELNPLVRIPGVGKRVTSMDGS